MQLNDIKIQQTFTQLFSVKLLWNNEQFWMTWSNFLQISLNIHYVAAPYKITDQVKKIPVLITHQIQFLRIFGA